MDLNNAQKRYLRGLTHDINPVVMVASNGLTENVMTEIEQALERHELIKVKLRGDREQRTAWAAGISEATGATPVHQIGQVASFYRRNPKKPVIELPRR
ncbi:ribosome assembly RNA-binding protein YhbY [Marinihelvus fidelis]|uniref:Ribosome assembly RNA-binding protein YhbY n=1 Tax=Marinihelvus fidelis TaxID=2613842 RepID=A0A5N0TGS4_9GAMM|nr:ribosome assembly RNA-binding protein YhbY [Marinihelvus fidelis]KAA9132479.1 ribosome assembly RNA-binding protein YhbY [Marinihelvus fidelis]